MNNGSSTRKGRGQPRRRWNLKWDDNEEYRKENNIKAYKRVKLEKQKKKMGKTEEKAEQKFEKVDEEEEK